VFGLIEKGFVSEKIILSGINDEGNPLKWPIPVTERKDNTIHKMAAYSLITELQSSEANQKPKIIDLALKLPNWPLNILPLSRTTAANDTASIDSLKSQKIKAH